MHDRTLRAVSPCDATGRVGCVVGGTMSAVAVSWISWPAVGVLEEFCVPVR